MRGKDWQDGVWLDARAQARKETGLADDDLAGSLPVADGPSRRSGLLARVTEGA
jgi:hypothetical protein